MPRLFSLFTRVGASPMRLAPLCLIGSASTNASLTPQEVESRLSISLTQPTLQIFKDACQHFQDYDHLLIPQQQELFKCCKDKIQSLLNIQKNILDIESKRHRNEVIVQLNKELDDLETQLNDLYHQRDKILPRFELQPQMVGKHFESIMAHISSDYEQDVWCWLTEESKQAHPNVTHVANSLFVPRILFPVLNGSIFQSCLNNLEKRTKKNNVWQESQRILAYCADVVQKQIDDAYGELLSCLKFHESSNTIDNKFAFKDDETCIIRCFCDKSLLQKAGTINHWENLPACSLFWINKGGKKATGSEDSNGTVMGRTNKDWNACDLIFKKIGGRWFFTSVCPSPKQIVADGGVSEALPLKEKLTELFEWNEQQYSQFTTDFITSCSNHLWALLMQFDTILFDKKFCTESILNELPDFFDVQAIYSPTQKETKIEISPQHKKSSGVLMGITLNLAGDFRKNVGSFYWLSSCMIRPWTYNQLEASKLAEMNQQLERIDNKLSFFNKLKQIHQTNVRGGTKVKSLELSTKILELEEARDLKKQELQKQQQLHEDQGIDQELTRLRNLEQEAKDKIHASASALAQILWNSENAKRVEAVENDWLRFPRYNITSIDLDEGRLRQLLAEENGGTRVEYSLNDRAYFCTQFNKSTDAVHLDLFNSQLFMTFSNAAKGQAKISTKGNIFLKQFYPLPTGPTVWVEKVDLK